MMANEVYTEAGRQFSVRSSDRRSDELPVSPYISFGPQLNSAEFGSSSSFLPRVIGGGGV